MAATVKRFAYVRQVDFAEDQNGVKTYKERYLAETSEAAGAVLAIRRRAAHLQRWQPHHEDRDALVTNFVIRQRKHSLIYDLDVDYSTAPAEAESPNPLDRPADTEGGTIQESRPVYQDSQKRYLLNSAGRFLEGASEDFQFLTINVTKNVATNFPSWVLHYGQAVNSDTVQVLGLSCAPRTLKVSSISISTTQIEADTEFRQLRYQLVYNPETWDKFYLNRGYEEAVYFERKVMLPNFVEPQQVIYRTYERCTDARGEPVTEPVFLNTDGRRPRINPITKQPVTLQDEYDAMKRGVKLVSQIKDPLEPEDIVILRFSLRKEHPFSVLPLN